MKKLSKGYRKYLRKRKSEIRKTIIQTKDQNNQISALYPQSKINTESKTTSKSE